MATHGPDRLAPVDRRTVVPASALASEAPRSCGASAPHCTHRPPRIATELFARRPGLKNIHGQVL